MLTIPEFDFAPSVDKHKNAPFRKSRDWDVFYADTANEIYGTWECLSTLRKEIKTAIHEERIQVLCFVNTLESQIIQFMDLMVEGEFESHYYDRLWHQLCCMREDIDAIKKRIS